MYPLVHDTTTNHHHCNSSISNYSLRKEVCYAIPQRGVSTSARNNHQDILRGNNSPFTHLTTQLFALYQLAYLLANTSTSRLFIRKQSTPSVKILQDCMDNQMPQLASHNSSPQEVQDQKVRKVKSAIKSSFHGISP